MFPEGFIWGTGTSSTQVEGAHPRSDWAGWEQSGRVPRSGTGNGFAQRFVEDFALYRTLGLIDHRVSIAWTRIEPDQGRFDEAEVERYRVILEAAQAEGLRVWLCLHHATAPGWFEDLGGFADEGAAGYHWPRWVDTAAQMFGDLVHGWMPMAEPSSYALSGWLSASLPPGRTDFATYSRVARQLQVSWRDAWRQLRGAGQPVATLSGLSPVLEADDSAEARLARSLVDEAMWGPVVQGQRDGLVTVPGSAAVPLDDLAGSADLIGISCRPPITVNGEMAIRTVMGDNGSQLLAGLSRSLERVTEELTGVPLLITAPTRPAGLGTFGEGQQLAYLFELLQLVEAAVADGMAITGLMFEAPIDCYQFGRDGTLSTAGFARSGIIDADRQPRLGARLIGEVATTGQVPSDIEEYLDQVRD